MRSVNINEEKVKEGLLGLVFALVEVIRDTLKLQALKRVEAGSLTEEECERLGRALYELDEAIREIEADLGIVRAVEDVRRSLDHLVEEAVDLLFLVEPARAVATVSEGKGG